HPFYTKQFAFWVGRRCRVATIKDVAEETHLDWRTIKSLEMQYMRAQLRRPRPVFNARNRQNSPTRFAEEAKFLIASSKLIPCSRAGLRCTAVDRMDRASSTAATLRLSSRTNARG